MKLTLHHHDGRQETVDVRGYLEVHAVPLSPDLLRRQEAHDVADREELDRCLAAMTDAELKRFVLATLRSAGSAMAIQKQRQRAKKRVN